MLTVVVVVHLMIVAAMIGVVLLQKSEGGGLGIGSTGGFMTSRGTANVLTRATAMLAVAFFITSLVLSIIAGRERKPATFLPAPASQSAPGAPAGGVLNQLGGGQGQQQAPAAPSPSPPPSGPQVPQSQ